MGHTQAGAKKIVSRIHRLQGQLGGLLRSIEDQDDCYSILQTASACRGAFHGLFTELLEDHIRSHLTEAKDLKSARRESEEVLRILKSYLK